MNKLEKIRAHIYILRIKYYMNGCEKRKQYIIQRFLDAYYKHRKNICHKKEVTKEVKKEENMS